MPSVRAAAVFRLAWRWGREKGLRSLCVRAWQKLLPRLAARSLTSRIKSLKSNLNPNELLDFVWSDQARLIQPVQVRNEFAALIDYAFAGRRPTCVMEIGTLNGGTLFTFCRLAAGHACVISLDLPGGSFGGGYPAWKEKLYRAFALPGQQLHLIRANSHDPDTLAKIHQLLNGRQLDFLLIDGDHTYEGVKQDFDMYAPLVKEGGIVAFHDIVKHPHAEGSQVDLFWRQVQDEYDHREFVENPSQQWAGVGVVTMPRSDRVNPDLS